MIRQNERLQSGSINTKHNGAAFFHTNPSGKVVIVNNLVVVFKDKMDKAGKGTTIGWKMEAEK